MTNPTPHGQVPAIQRYKIGYHSDEWGVRSLSPTGIYDDAGPWVRYEDHAAVITALRTQQQECGNTPYDEGPFALEQPAPSEATEEVKNLRKALVYVAFALHDTPKYMLAQGITLINDDTVRVSRDGWTVEASVNPHRQPAPAGATELAEADRRAGAAERELAACKEDVARFERVRDQMKEQWGVSRNVSFDTVWTEALALKAAQPAPATQQAGDLPESLVKWAYSPELVETGNHWQQGYEHARAWVHVQLSCSNIAPQPSPQAGAVPLTDEMASKAGRALSDLYATECGVDKEDNWKVYGSDFIATAKLVLEAVGIKGGQHGADN